LKSSKKN
jgi:hypothetical protein